MTDDPSVLGYAWLRYGVIERRRQGRRNVAMIDAAVLRGRQRQADLRRAWPEFGHGNGAPLRLYEHGPVRADASGGAAELKTFEIPEADRG